MSLYKKYRIRTAYSFIGSVEDKDDLTNMNAPRQGMLVHVNKLKNIYVFLGGEWQRFTDFTREDIDTGSENAIYTDYFLSSIKNNVPITPRDIRDILSPSGFLEQSSRFLIFS